MNLASMRSQLKVRHLHTSVTRLGTAMEPEGECERDGVLNPAGVLDREGRVLLFTRAVARGNVSRIGIARVRERPDGSLDVERMGFALEPAVKYELDGHMGMGCEDPRVTFLPALDLYLMGYTAYGAQGPRIAFAWSHDAYEWHRLGLCQFPERYRFSRDDKDVGFSRACALALRHSVDCLLPSPDEANCYTRRSRQYPEHSQAACGYATVHPIAYVPLSAVRDNLHSLLQPQESRLVMAPSNQWGRVKVGGGTAPCVYPRGGCRSITEWMLYLARLGATLCATARVWSSTTTRARTCCDTALRLRSSVRRPKRN